MNNKALLAGMLMVLPSAMMAQTALDAFSISQNDLRGTARFMSMGGAFTALGGDISTLNQNPGGIGVYRSSDLSATLDITRHSSDFNSVGGSTSHSFTRAACNNFGYIGTVNLGSNSVMPFFNWGASYSRVASFDRRYRGSLGNIGSSYSNFVADIANRGNGTNGGYRPNELLQTQDYNPYQDSYAPWSSILAFNSYLINPVSPGANMYTGLMAYDSQGNPVTPALADVDIQEKGYIDEYSINFGGNISNTVYWGIGFGITDLDYKSESYYSESLDNANVPDEAGTSYVRGGSADFTLGNYKHIWGSGFNFKAGVIIKPINEFRIGIAIHTPTYYNLSYEGSASLGYLYQSDTYPLENPENPGSKRKVYSGSEITDDGYLDNFDWQCRTPWRLMVGVAGVIGGRAILSADYEYRATNDIKVLDYDGNEWTDVTSDVKTYYKSTNILRLGAEYRLTPQFSLRAGYMYETSPVQTDVMRGYNETPNGVEATYMHTSGPDDTETLPSYTLDKQTQYFTCGLGYRYKNFYADAAYVHRHRSSKFSAFSNYNDIDGYFNEAPTAKVTDDNNSFVLTVGFRF